MKAPRKKPAAQDATAPPVVEIQKRFDSILMLTPGLSAHFFVAGRRAT
jgi:hypothetical protein